MFVKSKDVEESTKKQFCNYHNNDCFTCVYRLTDEIGLWCRAEGEYIYEYKNEINKK